MKIFLLAVLSLISSISYSQGFEWMTKEKMNELEAGKFEYANLSVEKELIIEGTEDVLLDLSSVDLPSNIDSMAVVLTKDAYKQRFVSLTLRPFLLNQIDSTVTIRLYAFQAGDTLLLKSSGKNLAMLKVEYRERPSFVSDTVVFGFLALVLALIFYTSNLMSARWKKFYMIVPALLLCYLIPAILDTLGLISKEYSALYPMAKNYLLPAALILMTLGIDFKGILNLGPKALIMFVTATVGIVIGGPIAILIYSYIDPEVVGGIANDSAWRGFATLAGSWIGGGANQAAMLETYKYNPDLYGKMVTVDIVVANLWMAFLLWGAARAHKFDKWLKADSSSIEKLKKKVTDYQSSIARNPSLTDYMVILGITFSVVAIGHVGGKFIADFFMSIFGAENPLSSSFFWLVVITTTGGLLMAMTKLRKYEGAGASKIGSVFIYILVATIGMKMELERAIEEPQLILVGIIWMLIHVIILFTVAKIIKAPFFFVAVGSKANVGGAASAPIIAAAFHPSLASVGAILAVLGYALGTYGAIACAEMMRLVAP